jgi:hypothetical protein
VHLCGCACFDVCYVSKQGERRLARIIPHGPTACIDSGTEPTCIVLSCGVPGIFSSDASNGTAVTLTMGLYAAICVFIFLWIHWVAALF